MQDIKILLNPWEVLLSSTLLISEGQEVRFELFPEDPLNITILFETIAPTEGKAVEKTLKFSGNGNESVISLVNWDNPNETSTAKPAEFAEDDKGNVYACMCSAKRIGKVKKLFLQIMRRKPL